MTCKRAGGGKKKKRKKRNGDVQIKTDLKDNYYMYEPSLAHALKQTKKHIKNNLRVKGMILYETNRNVNTDDIQELNTDRILNIKD